MSHYRRIPKPDKGLENAAPVQGTIGEFRMLPPADLLVDSRYQREIGGAGNMKIRRIATRFDWGKFAPLLVVQLEGSDVYAIIDGQHRASAAAARGDIPLVPCFVLKLPLKAQAETFIAINNEGARISTGALWHARAAAGDKEAIETINCATAAGVKIPRSPVSAQFCRHDITNAPQAIADCIRRYGFDVTKLTLETLKNAGALRSRQLITRVFIRSLAMVLRNNKQWHGAPIHILIGDLEAQDVEARARIQAREGKGSPIEIAARIFHDTIARGLK